MFFPANLKTCLLSTYVLTLSLATYISKNRSVVLTQLWLLVTLMASVPNNEHINRSVTLLDNYSSV